MPKDDATQLTVVLPVYNGAAFLRATLDKAWAWLAARERACELLVVDDGSRDDTPAILREFVAAHAGASRTRLAVLTNTPNRGKGFSLCRAFLHARGEHVAFLDADLTYELDGLEPLLAALRNGADVAYGSRMHEGSRYVVAPTFFGKLFTRHLMGRCFNLLVRLLVVRGIRDTQAGIKGFRTAAARQLATRVRLPRFSFDVELFFVARHLGLRIDECPVRFLYRKEPSTVKFFRDSVAMMVDMLRVRWRGLRGAYDGERDAAALADLRGDAAVVPSTIEPTVEPRVVTRRHSG
ncbi:MAG: glycosyltransferase [Planctomycetes bacterium]|nr:glycosyltransferase [Planctomycetota bacterium]